MFVPRHHRPAYWAHSEFYLSAYRGLGRVLRVPGWKVVWVNLSSPVGTDQSKLTSRHNELARRVEAEVSPFEYLGVRTTEGNGVIHALWVFPPRGGKAVRISSYQRLRAMWSAVLPGARNSLFQIVGNRGADDIRLARYMAGQCGYVTSFRSKGWNTLVDLAEVVGEPLDLAVPLTGQGAEDELAADTAGE